MKKSLIPIAVAMVAALTVASCKNNRKAQSQEPTQEEIQEMKLALADSVMAQIDALAEQFINVSDKADFLASVTLTEKEKMIKPDYLLELSEASKFVTQDQKVNALAIYALEAFVRYLYDMPMDEVKEVIAKLALELNHPVQLSKIIEGDDRTASERIRIVYDYCKQNGQLAYFWQFENAILREIDYLVANNTDLFFRNITEEGYQAYNQQWGYFKDAVSRLAEYDDEMNKIIESSFIKLSGESDTDEVVSTYFSTKEAAYETFKSDKCNFIERRNALLK